MEYPGRVPWSKARTNNKLGPHMAQEPRATLGEGERSHLFVIPALFHGPDYSVTLQLLTCKDSRKKKDLVEGAIACSCPSLCVSGHKVNVLKSMNYEWLTTEIIPQIITVKKKLPNLANWNGSELAFILELWRAPGKNIFG